MDARMLGMFGLPGYMEVVVIAFVGLLLFGKRLPEVARSLGRSVVEFKKGVRDFKDEVDHSGDGERRAVPPPARPSGALPTEAASEPAPQPAPPAASSPPPPPLPSSQRDEASSASEQK